MIYTVFASILELFAWNWSTDIYYIFRDIGPKKKNMAMLQISFMRSTLIYQFSTNRRTKYIRSFDFHRPHTSISDKRFIFIFTSGPSWFAKKWVDRRSSFWRWSQKGNHKFLFYRVYCFWSGIINVRIPTKCELRLKYLQPTIKAVHSLLLNGITSWSPEISVVQNGYHDKIDTQLYVIYLECSAIIIYNDSVRLDDV